MKITLTLCILLCLLGCDPTDDRLRVVNKSDEKIYLLESHRRELSSQYQDDIKQNGRGFGFTNYIEEIDANDTTVLHMGGNSNHAWERYINNVCEDGKLRLYTFSLDTLQKYSWRTVLEKEYYNKKVELSVKDLDKRNWVVIFD